MTTQTNPARGLVPHLALLVATVLTGLSAGFFYTYEASVTGALAQVSDEAYVETFQSINETIQNPAFGLVFFGSIIAVVVAIGLNWKHSSATVRVVLIAALVMYLGGLAITGTGNVPLNDDLAQVVVRSVDDARSARAAFESDWNRLNLLRSLAIGASFVALAAVPVVASLRTENESHRRVVVEV